MIYRLIILVFLHTVCVYVCVRVDLVEQQCIIIQPKPGATMQCSTAFVSHSILVVCVYARVGACALLIIHASSTFDLNLVTLMSS